MYKPLINKTRIAIRVKNKPLMFLKDDVKSAVKFYKKYSDVNRLANEKPKIHAIFSDFYNKHYGVKYHKLGINFYNEIYRNWLFDYSFKDVI